MSIDQQMNDEMKDAMRAKDKDRLACIRQVKAKLQEVQNAEGFKGDPKNPDDTLWRDVIGAYVKMLKKSIGELEKAGGQGDALRVRYQAEVTYLERYLPQSMSEAETLAVVQKVVAELGVSGKSNAGKVMGAIMKDHKGAVDPAVVRRLVEQVLG
jgi:hypothetical protein